LQIFYYTGLHIWKEKIVSAESRLVEQQVGHKQSAEEISESDAGSRSQDQGSFYRLVHVSENSWLMGEPVTSKITLILPVCYKKLGEKIEEKFKKMGGKWYTHAYPALVNIVRYLTLPLWIHYVMLFITVSIGMDLRKMLGIEYRRQRNKSNLLP
jgi:hypothetical protein